MRRIDYDEAIQLAHKGDIDTDNHTFGMLEHYEEDGYLGTARTNERETIFTNITTLKHKILREPMTAQEFYNKGFEDNRTGMRTMDIRGKSMNMNPAEAHEMKKDFLCIETNPKIKE